MPTFSESDDLAGSEFVDVDLRGSRFAGADLSDAVMRGVDVCNVEIESPWLFDGSGFLQINGVDVVPFIDAELDRRFPGRAERHATDPEALRHAWATLERTWNAALARVAAMPAGTVDISVAGEWTFAQTLRHLVGATDIWLRKAILGIEQPLHPLGLLHDGAPVDASAPTPVTPAYDEVLDARAGRVAMVRDFLASVTPADLAAERPNPHGLPYPETTLSCLHTILNEEWEHHRYAVRDLDAIDAGPP